MNSNPSRLGTNRRPGAPSPFRALLAAALAAAAVACAEGAALPAAERSAPAAAGDDEVAARLLAAHNRARAAVGAAPLAWDAALASGAMDHAIALSLTGQLVHSSRESRRGQGENLWLGTRGHFRPEAMVENWVSEREMFRPGAFPDVTTTGNWADVGHYTQIIWPETTSVGCGIASSPRFDFLVCRYAPAGNVDGRRIP